MPEDIVRLNKVNNTQLSEKGQINPGTIPRGLLKPYFKYINQTLNTGEFCNMNLQQHLSTSDSNGRRCVKYLFVEESTLSARLRAAQTG